MKPVHSSTILVSPRTRVPLFRDNQTLTTHDQQESFKTDNNIALLLNGNDSTTSLRHEIDVFDNLPVQGISYFRPSIYRYMIARLQSYLPVSDQQLFRFAELGGGEGHCARQVADQIKPSEVYVCDLSTVALGQAPAPLQRICADITQPVFAPDSLNAAAFWVSLHHIPDMQRVQALTEAFHALKEGGILVLFEPNNAFFVRRLVYNSSCRHDIYFDEHENAVDFNKITTIAEGIGFKELATHYLNPPYNPSFVRQLQRWWFYICGVEVLFRAGNAIKQLQSGKHTSPFRHASLYGMSFFRKQHA